MTKPALDTYGGTLRDFGYPGGIATMNPVSTRSLTNNQAIDIQFGSAVARSNTDDSCKAPTADGDKIIGLALRQPLRPADVTTGLTAFKQYDSVPILSDGDMWAVSAEAVTRGDQVISITAGNGALGSTTGGAVGAGRVAVPGAVWEFSTTANQTNKIRIVN